MNRIRLNREQQQKAARWVEDKSWVIQEKYELDQEYMDCVQDILNHEVFQSMDQFIQHGKTTCKTHCIQVSYLAYTICKKMGWDFKTAARAGLLHDFFLYDWHTHAKETGNRFHGYTHPRVALNNADKYFDLTDTERNTILCHMWPLTPLPPKSRPGMAVTYADKFCSVAEVAARGKKWLHAALQPRYSRPVWGYRQKIRRKP